MENGSFSAVLGSLDPVSRALLDLSLRRGLRPEEIAGVLGTDEESVVDARDRALVQVADDMGIEGDDRLDQVRALLAELPSEEWSAQASVALPDDDAAEPEEDPGEELDAMATAGPDTALFEEAEHELEANGNGEVATDRLVPPPEFIPREELAPADGEPEPEADEEDEPEPAPEFIAREELAPAEDPPVAETEAEPEPEPEPDAEQEPVPVAAAPARGERAPEKKKGRGRTVALLTLLTLLLSVAVLLAVLASGDDDSNPAPSDASTTPAPAEERAEDATRLEPVGNAARRARGTAQLTDDGERIAVNVRGLPPAGEGMYTVWLYSSVIDARSLGSGRRSIELDAAVPGKLDRYRFVDVSFEPADGNRNHSGRSILRTPVAELTKK